MGRSRRTHILVASAIRLFAPSAGGREIQCRLRYIRPARSAAVVRTLIRRAIPLPQAGQSRRVDKDGRRLRVEHIQQGRRTIGPSRFRAASSGCATPWVCITSAVWSPIPEWIFRLWISQQAHPEQTLNIETRKKTPSSAKDGHANGDRDDQHEAARERARLRVTKRIKDAIAKIRLTHPELARHLATCIRTGYSCSYGGDGQPPTHWAT